MENILNQRSSTSIPDTATHKINKPDRSTSMNKPEKYDSDQRGTVGEIHVNLMKYQHSTPLNQGHAKLVEIMEYVHLIDVHLQNAHMKSIVKKTKIMTKSLTSWINAEGHHPVQQ